MAMGDDDLRERPAGLVERSEIGASSGASMAAQAPRRRIVHQRADIVGEAAEGADLGGHAMLLAARAALASTELAGPKPAALA